MRLEDIEITTQGLDHLGLVAAVAHGLGIVQKVDARLPLSRQKGGVVTMGERVLAMMLNGLGFLNDRLYMVSSFFETKPVSRLIAPHVKAEHLNDDALGRCLDAIHGYGSTKLFSEIAFEIALEKGLLGKNAHLDTTSISVIGEYDVEEEDGVPKITYGHSKDHRPDLKQVVLSLTTTGKARFPIWMEALDGNSSDKANFHETLRKMTAFQEQLKEAPSFIFVADSALYTPEKLLNAPHLRFISRVPETIKEAQLLCQTPKEDLCWTELRDGYAMTNLGSLYGGIKQRWQLIFSEQACKREQKTLIRKIATEGEQLDKELWHAGNRMYTCKLDAEKAAKTLSKGVRYHTIFHAIEVVKKHADSGKPKRDKVPQIIGYQIHAKSERDAEKIAKKEITLGRFILATNVLDYEHLRDDTILAEYKQQSQVEGGFRFLKDPCFQVSSVFLKSPHRIEALMMVMTLCLMVYNMAQFHLRRALTENNDTVPNQLGKPVQNPTSRWIFRMMLDVAVAQVKLGDNIVKESITNLSDTTRKIIRYFGDHAMKIYDVAPLANQAPFG